MIGPKKPLLPPPELKPVDEVAFIIVIVPLAAVICIDVSVVDPVLNTN